jgi:hypothetical protein
MAAPQKNAPSKQPSGSGGSSKLAGLATPQGILATAFLFAAVIIYLFTVGPLSDHGGLPAATRTPGFGSPLAAAPHMACDTGTKTKTMSGSDPQTLDQIALEGRENARSVSSRAQLYQISLDTPEEATAKQALISWSDGASADPLLQVRAEKSADGAGWRIASVITCG